MPTISNQRSFNGFDEKVKRLGLGTRYEEALSTLSFQLIIEQRRFANGTKPIRQWIDEAFSGLAGWSQKKSGGIDWQAQNVQGATLGVEVQVSGRSDLLAVDVLHFAEAIRKGEVDAGLIIVPDDEMSRYLTDRTPNFRTALRHIVNGKAEDLPIQIVAFRHNGVGDAIAKMRTNLGRSRE